MVVVSLNYGVTQYNMEDPQYICHVWQDVRSG